MSEPEHVVIHLPLSVDAVAAISRGITAVWPEAAVLYGVKAAQYGPDKLVIELSGPKVEQDDDACPDDPDGLHYHGCGCEQ